MTYRLVVVLKVGELLTGSIVVITNIGIEEVALDYQYQYICHLTDRSSPAVLAG